jgi:hypothetical protein
MIAIAMPFPSCHVHRVSKSVIKVASRDHRPHEQKRDNRFLPVNNYTQYVRTVGIVMDEQVDCTSNVRRY